MATLATQNHRTPPTPVWRLSPPWSRLRAGWSGAASAAVGLALWVALGWLLVAAAVALTLPAPAAATPTTRFVPIPGLTAHIHQPGLPAWPIPVDRDAYDEYYRGVQESDDDAIEHAFTAFEWIQAADGQAVEIVQIDGEAIQVELLEGPHVGRRAWLKPRHLRP